MKDYVYRYSLLSGYGCKMTDIKLSPDQESAMAAVLDNPTQNFFITGSAGTGKSLLLSKLQEILRCPITASTGIAAVGVGGVTLHSYLGVGLANGTAPECLRDARKYARRRYIIRDLIVDEISMLSAEFLDKIDMVTRYVRGNHDMPFGGIRLIMFGDFMQLSPVAGNFAFTSGFWNTVKTIQLTTVHRQKDAKFIKMLQQVRMGNLTRSTLDAINSRMVSPDEKTKVSSLLLRSRNDEVDAINAHGLSLLQGEEKTFTSFDSGTLTHLTHLHAGSILSLKAGARVMLLTNLNVSEKLCNGSCGTTLEFSDNHIIIKFDSGNTVAITRHLFKIEINKTLVASRLQFPLRVAYAVTIHKSQGMSLDAADIDFSNIFTAGQAYVALSRVRSLEGITLHGFSLEKILINHEARDFYNNL